MIDNLAIDVILVTTLIDEHILVILPEKRKATVCDSKPDAMKNRGDTLANAVANGVDTGMKTSKNTYRTDVDPKKTGNSLHLYQTPNNLWLNLNP